MKKVDKVDVSRRILFSLAFLLAPTAVKSQQKWIQFLSPDGSYEIDYPDKSPVITADPQKLPDGTLTGFTLNKAQLMLSANLHFLSTSVALGRFVLPDTQLDAATQKMKSLPNVVLEKMENSPFKDYPARRMRLKQSAGDFLIDARLVCSKKYQIVAIATYATTLFEAYPETKEMIEHFSDSLTILA